jgi:hypothetical protein
MEYLVIRKGKKDESLLMGREGQMTVEAVKLMLKMLIDRSGLKENSRFIPVFV